MKIIQKITSNTVVRSLLQRLQRFFFRQPSMIGIALGIYCMVLSLTPSLLPRTWLFQGMVCGISLFFGYSLAAIATSIWRFLEIPELTGIKRTYALRAGMAINLALLIFVMTKVGNWQNRVRDLVGVDPSSTTNPFRIVFVAILLAYVLLLISRFIIGINRRITSFTAKYVPKRVAVIVGALAAFWLFGSVVSGALGRQVVRIANNTFSLADKTTPDGSLTPTTDLRSASPNSLVSWDDAGKQGRRFLGNGPTLDELKRFDETAIEPIRVYVGLANGETHEQRADVLLQELIRTNAFERERIVIATTTGTGYLDPNAIDTFEYMHGGDTAIAAQQYSFLPSWLALLTDTETAKEASIAQFNAIHSYWQDLDEETRPQLYLYGLSLGAYGSQASISRVELLNDPVDGALWAGPPFVSQFWNRITDNRDEGSPEWLPVYKDGKVIRFTGDENNLDDLPGKWQENKIIYLQYPTDPVVFFSTDLLTEEPSWLQGERGPGVTKDMRWYPFVTFWQVAFDLLSADSTEEGFGHLYSTDSYIHSWAALTEPENWTNEKENNLKAFFNE